MGTKHSKNKNGTTTTTATTRTKSTTKSSSAILSYSGDGSYLGRLDNRGRRSGLGIECFGYGLVSGVAYAGQWKQDQWHGWGVVFFPPFLLPNHTTNPHDTHDTHNDTPPKIEWFLGKFKHGQLNGSAIQYDLIHPATMHLQGIWRKNEIVLTQKVPQRCITEARKKVGQALSLARNIDTTVKHETSFLENNGAREGRTIDVWDPEAMATVRVLISAVNTYAGTITIRRRTDGGVIRGGGSQETMDSINTSVFLQDWLRGGGSSRNGGTTTMVSRVVLPATANVSRTFAMDRLNELKSSQLALLNQTMEQQQRQQRNASPSLRRRRDQDEQHNRFQAEPRQAPPEVPQGGSTSGRSTSRSTRGGSTSGGSSRRDLNGLTEQEVQRMTRIDGWSERELRALARVRLQQQERRRIVLEQQQQQFQHQRSRRSPQSLVASSSSRRFRNTLPVEDDMLFYANPDASVDTLHDVFMLSGDDPSFSHANHHQHNNPFDDYSNDYNEYANDYANDHTRNEREQKTTKSKENSSDKLKRLLRVKRERNSTEIKTCSICLDQITSNRDKRMLSCGKKGVLLFCSRISC
jgi:hypothetical protein